MPRALLAAAISLFLLGPVAAQTTQTWEYAGSGQWQPIARPTTAPASDPELDAIGQVMNGGHYARAQAIAIAWFKSHRQSPLADRSLMMIAECENRIGDGITAFYYLDELLDEYPESGLFAVALQRQYEIADSYLRGRKRSFLGMYVLSTDEEAIEMLYRIQQRSIGSPVAEKALLRTADWYFWNRDYDLAEDAYGAFVRQYPRSPSVPHARLRQAYASYALFHGPRFEVTPLIDARERLRAVMAEYPQLGQRENIPAMLVDIDAAMARKLYLTGDFYQRTHEPRAAAFTYRYLLVAYPGCADAPNARKRLAAIPAADRDTPEPTVQQDSATLRGTEPLPEMKVR